MRKTFTLLKANLSDSYGTNKVTVDLRSAMLAAVIGSAAVLGIFFISWYYSLMADVLFEVGMEDALLTTIALAGSVIAFFIAVYTAPGYLYAAKDFNLLAALPVKPGAILGSKLLALYITGFLVCFALTLPGIIVYGVKSGAGFVFYAAGILATLMLPMIPLILGAALAFPIMYAGSRFRYANAITVGFYFLLIAGILAGSFFMTAQPPEAMGAGAEAVTGIAQFYPPIQLFSEALGTGSATSWLLLVASSVVLPVIVVIIFAKSYLRINTVLSESHARKNFKLGNVAVSGVHTALLGKEMKLFASAPIYILNTSVGMLMFAMSVIAVAFLGYDTIAFYLTLPPGGGELVLVILAAVGMFCIGTSTVTAPSVSMEGSTLWIIKTLPVRFWHIAKAKIALNLIITVPLTIICTAVLSFTLNAGWVLFVGLTLALVGLCVFTAAIGLIINLYYPKLDWKNPTQAVKQSASVILTILVNMTVIALCGVTFFFGNFPLTVFVYAVAGVITVLGFGLLVYLYKAGQRLFDAL